MDMTKTWESAFLEKILAGTDKAAFDPKDTEKFYLREMRELRTRAEAVINTHYEGQGYMPVDLMVDIINQIKPTPDQKVAVFDRISALMMKMVGCDVTLFDKGAGFVNSGMKFDIVVGNPPYQSEKRGKKLWPLFISKAFELSTVVALVTPTGFMKSTTSNQGEYLSLMTKNGLKVVDTSAMKYFNVGIPICYWISDKSHSGNFYVDGVSFNNDTVSVPNDVSPLVLSIINKVKSFENKFSFKRAPRNIDSSNVSFKRLNHLGSKINAKIDSSGDLFFFTDEPEKFMKLLNSSLFNFVNKKDRRDPVIYHYYMSSYSYPDLVDVTSEKTIFSSYGLTEEEISLIESI